MEYYSYPCKHCGNCCRHVDLIAEMASFNRGDGVCKHLTTDNLCKFMLHVRHCATASMFTKNFSLTLQSKSFIR